MTVQNVPNVITYVANGVQTSFAFNFRVNSVAWVIVDHSTNLSGISLNLDQDSAPGGTVDYSIPPPSGQGIQINRQTPVTQATQYTRYDPFDAESNEDNLDKLTMIIQDMTADVNTILANFRWEFVPVAGNRDLVFTDRFKMLQSIDAAGAQIITIPPVSVDLPWEVGDQVSFEQKGLASLSLLAGPGVNIDSPASLSVSAQFGTITAVMDEVNNWFVIGNIAP